LKTIIKNMKNKIIVVTGGSTGIGLAVAKQLAFEGATIILVARNKEELESASKCLIELTHRQHYIYSLDVSDWENVSTFAEYIKTNWYKIDGLVNCAGIHGPIGATVLLNPTDMINAIQVNLMGTLHMCVALSNLFNDEKRKKIVNFSGGGAVNPFPNYTAYSMSKAGVVRFTENFALEMAEYNFDVNCVAPGFVATRIHKQTLDAGAEIVGKEYYERTVNQLKDGAVPAEKAAELVSFLLSSESDGITGKLISAIWDDWKNENFQEILRSDKDFATLRRIDNKQFYKK